MVLATRVAEAIKADLLKVLQHLRKQGLIIRVTDLVTIKEIVYRFYNSGLMLAEEISFCKEVYSATHQDVIRLSWVWFSKDSTWYRYYSFNPKDTVAYKALTVRFYLNPKISFFPQVVLKLFGTYASLPAEDKQPMQIKFLDPDKLTKNRLQRVDKVVCYLSHKSNLAVYFQDAIKSMPDNWFYPAEVLFTRYLAPGRANSYEPSQSGPILDIIRDLEKDKEYEVSFGEYMSTAIAVSLRMAIMNNNMQMEGDFFNFARMTDSQMAFLHTELSKFVINRANEDLIV